MRRIEIAHISDILENPDLYRDLIARYFADTEPLSSILPDWWSFSLRELREIHEALILDGWTVGYNPYRWRMGMPEMGMMFDTGELRDSIGSDERAINPGVEIKTKTGYFVPDPMTGELKFVIR
jgi:hypothetical protein